MIDVVIIGGGPAGSTAANLLAASGHSVRVLEKETFPRFHIGESLLPADLPIFARLGVTPSTSAGIQKLGADFLDERTGELCRFMFADGLPGTPPRAFQVERAIFDAELLDRARARGAEVVHGERALEVRVEDGAAVVRTDRGAHRARFVVDATGQDALLGRARRTIERVEGMGIAACFCHFEGLSEGAYAELTETGNITILMRELGWAWVIPLSRGRLSVGVVSAKQGMSPAHLDALLAESPYLQRLTAGATRSEARLIGNFSYMNRAPRGSRYGCIGDAAGFLDPVFSSGVTLAMFSGEKLADLLSPALRAGTEDDPELLAPLGVHMEEAYDVFASIIHSFYHTGLVKNLFFYEDPESQIRAGVISILAGDVFRNDNLFKQMLLRSTRRRRRLKESAR